MLLVEYPYLSLPAVAPEYASYKPAVTLLTKRVEEGWIIGGGVFVESNKIISARHLDTGTDWCYTTGVIKEDTLHCNNIVAVINHPSRDLAVILLQSSEASYVAVGHLNTLKPVLISSVIDFRVEFRAANVKASGNTFITQAGLSRAGDSGSPVFQDGKVVSIVRGDSMVGDVYTPIDPDWVTHVTLSALARNGR